MGLIYDINSLIYQLNKNDVITKLGSLSEINTLTTKIDNLTTIIGNINTALLDASNLIGE